MEPLFRSLVADNVQNILDLGTGNVEVCVKIVSSCRMFERGANTAVVAT